jgi:2'-5' RNA ligase
MPLFFAAWPPADVTAFYAGLPLSSADVRVVPRQMMHITLRFFGETDVNDAVTQLDQFEFRRAEAMLGPLTCELYGPNILGVAVAGLDDLVADIQAATADIGEPPEEQFFGHMALAASATSVASLVGCPAATAFPVLEVALVSSDWSDEVPQYTIVKTWTTTPTEV